ncbi:GNAT family N-acetyltransferase [Brevibacillus sedimenti]|uniref:GNAT family N-acetyltransferase n=1 Tax=Brevibacillus sedimenti TaxID=2613334 RepID=UPI001E4785F5|nr:GNAT family N-acetyltransferase [Anoxybacillus sediminis]UFJ61024.1 GNAT family N-acetyltransferase [Anoxybacillus sediminis]
MLETDRLLFRPYCLEDLPFLAGLLKDPDVVRYIGHGKPRTDEEVTRFYDWVQQSYASGLGLMVAVRKQDMQPIGHAGLVQQIVDGKPETEIGYWMAKEYWGNGYASEAAMAFREYGVAAKGLRRLICLIQPGNAASARVAQKIGMFREKETVFKEKLVHVYAWEQT